MSAIPSDSEPLVAGEATVRGKVPEALVHLAWSLAGGERRLIFGWVEILPSCFPPMPGHSFRPMKGKGDAPSLFVARFPMSSAEAEAWFEAAVAGELRLPAYPGRPTKGDGEPLSGPPFRVEPENGTESSSLDLPFLPSVHGMMRVRGLYSAHDPAFASTVTAPVSNAWLRANMFVDLDSHREYVGGLFLARHPRAVRDVSCQLSHPGGREVELVRIRHWPGVGLEGHKVLAIEQRPLGFGIPREIAVEDGLVEIDWNGKCDRTALSLLHPEDGVAWWLQPTGFLRSIQTNIDFIRETRRVTQAIDQSGNVTKSYDVSWRDAESPIGLSLVGEQTDTDHPADRSWSAEQRRDRIRLAAKLGLRWLDDSDAAQTAIRAIVAGARRSVTMVDPYFGPGQIRDFAMAVTAADVAVRIVTSEECMRQVPQGTTEAIGEAMERAIEQYTSSGWSRPEVLIMKGRHAPVHDRFLVADGRVWLSGNSLNAIGRRASVLIEVPNADEIVNRLAPLVDAAQPFTAWLAALRYESRAGTAGSGAEALPEAD